MSAPEDDQAWQAIVDNYGDRPEVEEPEPAAPAGDEWPDADEPAATPTAADEDRFVPPAPPPLPVPAPRRAIAWGGVFGAPVLMLLCMAAGLDLPAVLDYALLGWFVGGFGYLVATMPRAPREPWDDGSRI